MENQAKDGRRSDWDYFLAKADEKGLRAELIFFTDPYSFSERVSIKIDSGIPVNEALNQTFKGVLEEWQKQQGQ